MWSDHRKGAAWVSVLVAVLAFSLIFSVASAFALEKVSFRLNWKVYGEHAPFFLALEKGFYKDEGLDVAIGESVKGSGHTVSLVANKTDAIGYADSASTVRGIGQGMRIKSVAVYVQTSPMALISMMDKKPILSVKDIEGSSIAVVAGDSLYNVWPAIVAANKLDPNKIKLVLVSTGPAKAQYTLQGMSDALLGYFTTQPLLMEKESGRKTAILRFVDLGVNTLSQGFLVHEDTIKENPSMIRRFVKASTIAWEYAAKNPEEAVRALVKHNPDQDYGVGIGNFIRTRDLIYTANSKGKRAGWQSEKDWKETLDILEKYGGLQNRREAAFYFTNQFIPE